jgi:hypothetical protein
MTMLRIQAFAGLLWVSSLLGSCSGYGYCDYFPGRCQMDELTVNPAQLMVGSDTAPAALTLHSSTSWTLLPPGLHARLVSVSPAANIRLAELELSDDGSASVPGLDPSKLDPGEYSVRIYQDDKEVPLEKPPTLSVTVAPIQLSWFTQATKVEIKQTNADTNKGPLLTKGVWLDGTGKVLVRQDYTDTTNGKRTKVVQQNAENRFYTEQFPPPSLFDVFSFVPATQKPRAVWMREVVLSNLKMVDGLVTDTMGIYRGDVMQGVAMAAVATANRVGLLVRTASDFTGYSWDSTNMATSAPTPSGTVMDFVAMAGYADKVDGQGNTGVLVLDKQGALHLFSFDGTNFVNSAGMLPSLPTTSGVSFDMAKLAVGDLDGDKLNDLAIASNGKVYFFLRRGNAWVAAKDPLSLTVTPAALAIGQYDGMSKNDLLVADETGRVCASTPCSNVYVYLNNTKPVQ